MIRLIKSKKASQQIEWQGLLLLDGMAREDLAKEESCEQRPE